MAANALRLRRSLALTSSILNHSKHSSSVRLSVAPTSSPFTNQQNPSTFAVNRSRPSNISFQFISSRSISSRPRYNDGMNEDQISEDAILFEGCDYNHWLITMEFPKDPIPSPEEMVDTYVETAAKVLGSVEEAKKKIYACSTTTYNGFQVEVSEEVSEQFKGIPGVVFVLPDSYIDPVNKEYGGDKYINGTIIPRPPPVQFGRQGGRFNDRNRDYNRPPPRGQIEQGGPPRGQGNYQGDRRGPMPSYQSNYNNQGDGRNVSPPRSTDFPQSNFPPPPPPLGNYNQGGGGGGSYRQGTEGQYGQGGGYGGQYGQPGGGGNYGGQYGQGGGGQYGQGGGGGYGQGGGRQYGQGGGGGNYGSQGEGYGQGGYGQGVGSGSGQYGGNPGFSQADQRRDNPGQQGNYEEADAFRGR